MSSMTMFISDLPSKLVPGPAIIQGEEGEAIVSYLINNTFVASNPTGLAFAGVVPLSIASIEALQANPTRFIFVWKQVKRMILQVESCCLRKLHNFYRPFYSLTLCSWRTQASTHPLPYPSTFMHEGR
ncbi:unnamed protein product [Closterium sp. Yama58-4]|nr:unnamed protein product [Closterium sp. Yama58-4]